MPGCRRPTRCLLLLLLAIAMLTAAAAQSVVQTYPARPVTIITPFAAGSQTDAAARLLASHLQDALGQTFVVENKAGAGGLIAANTVARAKPDGSTLLLTTNSTPPPWPTSLPAISR
jgi:tripartite-type tricarboxylate transporter receptor subunit TctC